MKTFFSTVVKIYANHRNNNPWLCVAYIITKVSGKRTLAKGECL